MPLDNTQITTQNFHINHISFINFNIEQLERPNINDIEFNQYNYYLKIEVLASVIPEAVKKMKTLVYNLQNLEISSGFNFDLIGSFYLIHDNQINQKGSIENLDIAHQIPVFDDDLVNQYSNIVNLVNPEEFPSIESYEAFFSLHDLIKNATQTTKIYRLNFLWMAMVLICGENQKQMARIFCLIDEIQQIQQIYKKLYTTITDNWNEARQILPASIRETFPLSFDPLIFIDNKSRLSTAHLDPFQKEFLSREFTLEKMKEKSLNNAIFERNYYLITKIYHMRNAFVHAGINKFEFLDEYLPEFEYKISVFISTIFSRIFNQEMQTLEEVKEHWLNLYNTILEDLRNERINYLEYWKQVFDLIPSFSIR